MIEHDTLPLAGRVAVITGASRRIGIGAAIARAFAARGADLFLTYYRPYDAEMPWGSAADDVTDLVAELQAAGRRVAHGEYDLSQARCRAVLFDAAEAALGPVHVLVNNAAVSLMGDIQALGTATLDRHCAVNVRGMALLSAELVRRFKGDRGGRIINLTSGQGVGAMPDEIAYVTTKGAVEAFTSSAAPTAMRRGITVNAIDPGITDTGWISDEQRRAWAASAPAGRVGQPEDAARLVAFLASDEAAWITGQIMRSRGGL
ncbi:MAG: SDR family oxidoreductase [Caldilineaceae bacterium]